MIPDFKGAFEALFTTIAVLFFLVIFFAGYLAWSAIFSSTDWEVCVKMDADRAKIQCMETLNE